MNTLDLYRLYAEHDGDTWVVGFKAEREILLARDSSGFYLVAPAMSTEEPKLFGLPVRLDRDMSPGHIELRGRDGRVAGVIENAGAS